MVKVLFNVLTRIYGKLKYTHAIFFSIFLNFCYVFKYLKLYIFVILLVIVIYYKYTTVKSKHFACALVC